MVTRAQDGTRRPKVLCATRYSLPTTLLSNLQSNPIKPISYTNASKDPKLRQLVQEMMLLLEIRLGLLSPLTRDECCGVQINFQNQAKG